MTQQYRMASDSRSSARVLEPVILWASDDGTRRLAFLPHLHDNPNAPDACLSGQLRYQRKAAGDAFVDEAGLQLSNLRNGEWTKYELSSAATLSLFNTLANLYQLYATEGAPRGETTVLAIDGDLSAEVDALGEAQVGPLLGALLRRAARSDNPLDLADELTALGSRPLSDLRNAVGVANLRAALDEWSQLDATDESDWQDFFKRNEWILAQAFAQPVLMIRSGATVRPATLENSERRIVDYVYANALSRNLALVEIKTPAAQLLASTPYRGGIYRPAKELIGSVAQICAYRHDVKQYASTLLRGQARAALRADPQCVVIVGSLGQLDSQEKLDSFEQYRRELRNVQVLTFDEVRLRAEGMLELLSAPPAPQEEDQGSGFSLSPDDM